MNNASEWILLIGLAVSIILIAVASIAGAVILLRWL